MTRFARVFVRCWLCVLISLGVTTALRGQTEEPIETLPLNAKLLINTKLYPSLTPRTVIVIGYPESGNVYTYGSLTEPRTWIIRRFRDNKQEDLLPARVDVKTTPGAAYLYLNPKLIKKGDEFEVGLHAIDEATNKAVQLLDGTLSLPNQPGKPSRLKADSDPDTYTLSFDPSQANKQELLNGTKKDLGHLALKLDVPTLSRNLAGPHLYFKSDNVLSTDSRDRSAALDLTLGAETSLARQPFIPVAIENELLANEAFTNIAYVLSGKTQSIALPWGWTRGTPLYNRFLKSTGAEVGFGIQYEHRLRIDDRAPLSHAKTNLYRIAGQIALSPIHLLPGRGLGAKDVAIEVAAKGWLFPNEKATGGAKVRRREGYAEVSLVIPLAGIAATAAAAGGKQVDTPIPFVVKDPNEGTIKRLRIKYATGANEANNFARSAQLSLTFEIIK